MRILVQAETLAIRSLPYNGNPRYFILSQDTSFYAINNYCLPKIISYYPKNFLGFPKWCLEILVQKVRNVEAEVSVQKSQITLGNLIKINYTIPVRSVKYVVIKNALYVPETDI